VFHAGRLDRGTQRLVEVGRDPILRLRQQRPAESQAQVAPNKRLAHVLDTIHEGRAARERRRLDRAMTRRERRIILDKLARGDAP
jgi:hypothetical protein